MKTYTTDYTKLQLHSLYREVALFAKGRELLFQFGECKTGRVCMVNKLTNEKYLLNGYWQNGDDFYKLSLTDLGDQVGVSAKKVICS